MCFDDLVDKDGALRPEENNAATTSAVQPQTEEAGLRHRVTESKAAALGSSFANPFADESLLEHSEHLQEQTTRQESLSRSTTPTMPASPPVPPKPAAYQPQRLLIDTDDISNHPSEQLVNLTPTTSASSAAADLAELDQGESHQSLSSYMSVNEWAQNQSVQSLRSPALHMAETSHHEANVSTDVSVADSAEHVSQAGTEDMDVVSDFGEGINTPGTWTEVGSQVSED